MPVIALILSGGSGSRTGLSYPKQFYQLTGKSILAHTIDAFDTHDDVDAIYIVCRKEDTMETERIIIDESFRKVRSVINGGSTRQESSYNGIMNIRADDDDIVIIHDAARPFVTASLISACISSARKHGASLAAAQPTDTILLMKDGLIAQSFDRNLLVSAQTPQTFKFGIIKNAHAAARADGFTSATDDTMLSTRLGITCSVVASYPENIKITGAADLLTAETILASFKKFS